MNTLKIEQRDPAELRVSAQLKHIPALPPDSESFERIKRAVWETGLTRPLLIDQQGQVLTDDSRTLLAIARLQGLALVTVAIFDTESLPQLTIADLFGSRPLTMGARALCAVPYLEPALKFARNWRLTSLDQDQLHGRANAQNIGVSRNFFAELESVPAFNQGILADFGRHLKLNPEKMRVLESSSDKPTEAIMEAIAGWLGIKPRLLYQAIRVRREFDSDKALYWRTVAGGSQDGQPVEMTLEDWYLPQIMNCATGVERRSMCLGDCLSGIATDRTVDKSAFSPKSPQLELALGGLDTLTNRMLKLPSADMLKSIRKYYTDHGDSYTNEQLDQIEEMGEAIKAQARALRKAVKA